MLFTHRLLFLLLAGVPLIAWATWQPPAIYLAALYLLAVLVVAGLDLLTSTDPADLDARRLVDSKLSLGAENLVQIVVVNRSPFPLPIVARDEVPPACRPSQIFLTGDLPGRGETTLTYTLFPRIRGDHQFGNVTLRYPTRLGLLRRQRTVAIPAQVKVYPNLKEVKKYALLARRGQLQEVGLKTARLFGVGSEFERLRDYQTDDDFRRISWKATARRGRPITIEYETERSQTVMLVLDTGRLMTAASGPVGAAEQPETALSRLDYAINTALMLAYVATLRGDRVGLLAFADQVTHYLAPRRGKAQFYALLEALYAVKPQPVEADYARAFLFLDLKHRRRSLVTVFTELIDREASQILITHLGRLSPRHLPICVTISDPHVVRLATGAATASQAVYERAVANRMLDERRETLDLLARRGVITLDVPADRLTIALINQYLELKARSLL